MHNVNHFPWGHEQYFFRNFINRKNFLLHFLHSLIESDRLVYRTWGCVEQGKCAREGDNPLDFIYNLQKIAMVQDAHHTNAPTRQTVWELLQMFVTSLKFSASVKTTYSCVSQQRADVSSHCGVSRVTVGHGPVGLSLSRDPACLWWQIPATQESSNNFVQALHYWALLSRLDRYILDMKCVCCRQPLPWYFSSCWGSQNIRAQQICGLIRHGVCLWNTSYFICIDDWLTLQ